MSELLPLLVLAVILVFARVVKKKAAVIRARTYRPHPSETVKPAQPPQQEKYAFKNSETEFRPAGFETKSDFESGFSDTAPDPAVTYEEGIDPCHDGMEHASPAEPQAEPAMDRETANELVRAFVMSEILTRKKRG